MDVNKRIIEAFNYLKIHRKVINQSDLSKLLGKQKSYISEIFNNSREASEQFVLKFCEVFDQINAIWLLTGEGEMLKSNTIDDDTDAVIGGKLIPFYDVEVAAGNSYGMNMEAARPVGLLEIGGLLRDSESALRVYGNSMTPNYPAGCVVGLRSHMDSFIEPGTVYVVETLDNRYIKRLYYNKEKTAFRCVSDNHMTHDGGVMCGEFYYPDFEIPFVEVRRLFRVVGVIKRNQL